MCAMRRRSPTPRPVQLYRGGDGGGDRGSAVQRHDWHRARAKWAKRIEDMCDRQLSIIHETGLNFWMNVDPSGTSIPLLLVAIRKWLDMVLKSLGRLPLFEVEFDFRDNDEGCHAIFRAV